jgi:hypothetical protein
VTRNHLKVGAKIAKQQGEQVSVGACKGFTNHSVKLFLLASDNRLIPILFTFPKEVVKLSLSLSLSIQSIALCQP